LQNGLDGSEKQMPRRVASAFEQQTKRLPISDIQPLRVVSERIRRSRKYEQILCTVRENGLVEPPVVSKVKARGSKYLLLDGHLRLEALRTLGETHVNCLIATDDEAFTYNKRVNRLAAVQEHKMILKAIERGVSEEKLAKALNLNIKSIQQKRNLLNGICEEAVELLKDKHCPAKTFDLLKRVKPIRQVEAAELMVAMSNYSSSYAQAIVEVTPEHQLADRSGKKKHPVSRDEIERMERELSKLHGEIKEVENTYGPNILALVTMRSYVKLLLGNPKVFDYLDKHYPDLQREFANIVASSSLVSE
jgi:ParB-like chromosome segregation protein Spo0J